MKNGYIKSSPLFFNKIRYAMLTCAAVLLTLAALIPAPLQTAADPAHTPNPVKSAWFLLWIQELVSWSHLMVWPLMALAAAAFLLPWLPGQTRNHHAVWLATGQRRIAVLTLLGTAGVIALTLVALFMRGPNWSLPF
jgi:hypothetical protein